MVVTCQLLTGEAVLETVTAEAGGAGVKTTLEDCFVLLERLYLHMLGSNQALFKFSFLHLSLSSLR